jgi:chromosome segregation ATPase
MTSTEYQQLVEFLGQRFAEIDRRFTEIDRRFTEMDRGFLEIDGRLIGVDGHFTGLLGELRREILGHFDEIYRRLERLEQEYQAITQALRRIEAGLADDRGRQEILERDLSELKRHVAVLQSRIEDFEQRLGR